MFLTIFLATIILLLKHCLRLYCYHKPDILDYVKSFSSIPCDLTFLLAGIIAKITFEKNKANEFILVIFLVYIILAVFNTSIWRYCEEKINTSIDRRFLFAVFTNWLLSVIAVWASLSWIA